MLAQHVNIQKKTRFLRTYIRVLSSCHTKDHSGAFLRDTALVNGSQILFHKRITLKKETLYEFCFHGAWEFNISTMLPGSKLVFFPACRCQTTYKALIWRDLRFLHPCLCWKLESGFAGHWSRIFLYSFFNGCAISQTFVVSILSSLTSSLHRQSPTIVLWMGPDFWWMS